MFPEEFDVWPEGLRVCIFDKPHNLLYTPPGWVFTRRRLWLACLWGRTVGWREINWAITVESIFCARAGVNASALTVSPTTSVSFLECTGTGRWSANAPRRVGGTRAKPVAGFRGYVRWCHHTEGCVTMVDRVAFGLHWFRVVIIHHRVCYMRKENTF